MNKKILIDTDIGDDIDDAFAIAVALAAQSESYEIVGITTVYRNTAERARLAEKLVSVYGAEVPVIAGEELPINEPIRMFAKDNPSVKPEAQDICQWSEEYSSFPLRKGAVDFIIACAEKYGNELTIVPIGAMTNLARALQKAPEIMKTVCSIVSMGGWFTEGKPEWNIMCDPEAAQIAYSSGIPFYAVGLDVTLKCVLDKKLLCDFRNSESGVNILLTGWLDKWFSYFGFEKSVMHDPLAIACTLDDKICNFRKTYVKVPEDGNNRAIETSETEKEGFYPVNVAYSVDCDRFYSLIRRYLLEK